MRILLFNDNPVVSKLVTLSTQKTSDELDIVNSVDKIDNDAYDLLVIDDGLFYEGLLKDIKNKVSYTESLYVSDKSSDYFSGFDAVLKKPFLPRELVEQFLKLKKEFLSDIEHKIEDEFENDLLDDEDLVCDYEESVLDMDEVKELQELLEETQDEEEEPKSHEDDLEILIQSALEELSDEELNSVVDEKTVLDIAQNDTDVLDILDIDEIKSTDIAEAEKEKQPIEENGDVVALKNLLKALSQRDVVASLKDMKISINITLGSKNES